VNRLPLFASIKPSHAVFGLGLWQAVWIFVFFFAIDAVYANYAAVEFHALSAGMQEFLTYDARFISASFFLRASVCFLIAMSSDRVLQRRTLIFWSFFNLLPLALVLSYSDILENNLAFYIAAGIPCIEGLLLGYLGWVACAPKATPERW